MMRYRYHEACAPDHMQLPKLIAFIILGVHVLSASCTKEHSAENPLSAGRPLGNDCAVTTVTPYDPTSGHGYGSLHVTTGTNDLTTKIEWFDSSSGRMAYHAMFTYIKDTIRISKNEFFVLDSDGRIREFNTLENPPDPGSEHYKYIYTYDAGGHLVNKKWFLPAYSSDVPFFTYKYEWANENLVNIEVNEATGNKRLALKAELLYNDAKVVKNFVYFFPDADELAPYIFSVNVGKKSRNLLEKITVRIYDSDGKEIKAYTTEYRNYKFSPDDYVTELYASGDTVDGQPLINGLTRFEYNCK